MCRKLYNLIIIILSLIHTSSSSNITNVNTTTLTTSTSTTELPLTTTLGELFATINPDYQTIIEDLFLPDDYYLPNNIYQWNVSEIVYYINESDPDILYIMDTAYLITIFPEYFLQQLPRDILIAHQLYYLLPTNDTSFCSNCTNFTLTASSCVYPFVPTKHDTYFQCMTIPQCPHIPPLLQKHINFHIFTHNEINNNTKKGSFEDLNSSFECGLLCEYGDVLWGIPPKDQQLIDSFLYICSIVFLFMIIIVWTNQCMDLRLSNDERCCHRGFLFHAPLCLVSFYTFVALCFLVPLLIGKENVVCTEDIDDNLTVSSYVHL